MAELSQAYGFGDNDTFAPHNDYYEDSRDKHDMVEKPMQREKAQIQQAPPVSQPPKQVQPPPMATEFAPQQQKRAVSTNMSYSFGDRMAMKRSEVIKLAMFSLVIVMAIALDRMSTHYLTKYLSDNIFTEFQEFMLRLSYPVIIFIVLWVVKSL